MTMVPCMSTSSIAARIASVATRSASIRLPRPMSRAEAIAAASVTYAISSASSFSMAAAPGRSIIGRPPLGTSSMAEMPAAREHHREMVAIGDLDRHLVTDRAAGLDDRGHPGLGRHLDAVREREVRVAREDGQLGPIARAMQRDLDGDLAVRLPTPDTHRRGLLCEHDRVRPDVADRSPREQEVGQLLERRTTLGHDVELRLVEPELVHGLDEQAPRDALEVELRDPIVGEPIGGVRRHGEELDLGLLAERREGPLVEARC